MVNHGLFLREAVAKVGYIDEDRYSFYCADGDLSLKLWHAGYEVEACEGALLEHYGQAGMELRTGNLSHAKADWQQFISRWTGTISIRTNPI